MTKTLRISFVAAMATTLLSVSTTVHAQPKNEADKAYAEGRQAIKRKDYVVACEKFAQSQKLDASLYTTLGLAECEEKLGKLRLAWQHVQQVLTGLPANDEALPFAKQIAATLDKRVPRLTVKLSPESPSDTVVSINGLDIVRAEIGKPIAVDVGEVHVLARTPAGGEAKQTLALSEGEKREVTLAPWVESSEKPAATTEQKLAPSKAPAATEGDGSTTRVIGYVVTGLGAVALVGGGFFAIKYAGDAHDACVSPDGTAAHSQTVFDDCHAAQDKWKGDGTKAAVFGAIGAVAVGAGLYLVLSSDKADKVAGLRRTMIAPWFDATSRGAALSTTW